MSSFRPRGCSRSYDPLDGLVFERALGNDVWDQNGKRYLDLICGYSATNFGHAHEPLLEAATEQLRRLHFAPGADSSIRRLLERDLAELFLSTRVNEENTESAASGFVTPHTIAHADAFSDSNSTERENRSTNSNVKVWLSTTGARAMEVAWKIVHQRRPGKILRFDLGFHGRSLATSWISDTRRTSIFAVTQLHDRIVDSHAQQRSPASSIDGLDDNTIETSEQLVPEPYSITTPFPRCGSGCKVSCRACQQSLAEFETLIEQRGGDISAFFIEPAIGSRGYYFASPAHLRRLVQIARRAGILIVSDEIQMGLGRLGAMMVHHTDGWNADLVVLGKSLGGGIVPISAIVGHAELLDSLPEGIESETFAATPFACGVARRVLQILQTEQLPLRAIELGESFRAQLRDRLPDQFRVDGRGLATVIDMNDGSDRGPERTWYTVCAMRDKGILVHRTGPMRDRIAVMPALNIASTILMDAAIEIGRCISNGTST